jgi:phage recombination protein Bet
MEVASKINGGAAMNEAIAEREFSPEQIQLLKDIIAKGASDQEFALFLEIIKAKRLDPFQKHVYFVKRWDNDAKRETWAAQTGIDGYRLIADRSGDYAPGGQTVFECDKNGKLISATAFVKKWVRGEWHEISATAFFDEYVQLKKDGTPTSMWRKMPRIMLAKCAEALALRRAFPGELSGIYTHEEMGQAQIEAGSVPAQIEAGEPEAGLITREQRKQMNDFIAGLKMKFGLTNEILKAKMLDATGVEHSSELTEAQAEEMIGIYAMWLNQLEEAAAANTVEQKGVPF